MDDDVEDVPADERADGIIASSLSSKLIIAKFFYPFYTLLFPFTLV